MYPTYPQMPYSPIQGGNPASQFGVSQQAAMPQGIASLMPQYQAPGQPHGAMGGNPYGPGQAPMMAGGGVIGGQQMPQMMQPRQMAPMGMGFPGMFQPQMQPQQQQAPMDFMAFLNRQR